MRRGEEVRGILPLRLLLGFANLSSYFAAVAAPVAAVERGFGLTLSSSRPPPPDLLLLGGLRRWPQRGSQGAGSRRQFIVRGSTAGGGTRLARVPFSYVISA